MDDPSRFVRAAAVACPSSSLQQEPRLIQQADLCRWLLKTDIRMAACFSLDMQNNGFGCAPEPGPAPGSASEEPGCDGSVDLSANTTSQPHVVYDEVPATGADSPAARTAVMLRQMPGATLAEPPPPGPMSQKFAAEVLPDVNLMMHATQR